DNQNQVEIHVVQGEREFVADNKSLGRFVLDGIPPAPRGVPQVEVTFNLDANGILNVSAKDKGSGKEQSITIQGSSGLSKEEVEKMAKEAEAHAEEDKKKREGIESKNQLDSAIYQAEKMKTDNKEKISEDDVKVIDEAVETAKKVLADEKAEGETFEAAAKALTEAIMPIGAKMYEEAAKAESAEGDEDTKDAKDEAVEGEVVEDDTKDKKDKK
ncbi:MAG: Hsp70 family protein, partial [Candidatus Saccharibacteria bacterium]